MQQKIYISNTLNYNFFETHNICFIYDIRVHTSRTFVKGFVFSFLAIFCSIRLHTVSANRVNIRRFLFISRVRGQLTT